MFILIIIILLICILLIICTQNINKQNNLLEGIDDDVTVRGSKLWSTNKKFYNGPYNSKFNGRMAIDDQYFYDKLFDNVVYYPNEYNNDYELNDITSTGIEKCKKECQGNCVEFGQSSIAYCFNPIV